MTAPVDCPRRPARARHAVARAQTAKIGTTRIGTAQLLSRRRAAVPAGVRARTALTGAVAVRTPQEHASERRARAAGPDPRADVRAIAKALAMIVTTGVYAATMQWAYSTLVAPSFAYAGYRYVAPVWQTNVLTVGLVALVALLLPGRLVRPSHVVLWVLFGVCVAPAMLMSQYTGYLVPTHALSFAATLAGAFLIVALGVRRTAPEPSVTPGAPDTVAVGGRLIRRSTIAWTLCAVYSAITYGTMLATTGITFRLVGLDEVYDVRAAYADDLTTGGPLGYMLSGQAYVVNVYVMARALAQRNWSVFVLGVLGQFVLYSTTGFKTILFSIPAMVAVAVLLRRRRPRSGLPMFAGPVLVMVGSAVADALQGGVTWTSLFSRRFILTPGLLTTVYADYFSGNPVALWARSFTRFWVDSPYDTTPTKLIGQYMLPGSQVNANANLFADGFANLGPVGLFVIAVVLLVWLRVLDRFSEGIPIAVVGVLFVMSAVTLSNTSIMTAMLTHGLLVGTFLTAVMPRQGWGLFAPVEREALHSSRGLGQSTPRDVRAPRDGRSVPRRAPDLTPTRSVPGSRTARTAARRRRAPG